MLLIFDLDGTLIDSKLDLAHSVNAMLSHTGREQLPHELIFSYVGNGAPVLVRRALGPQASDAEHAAALEFFLAYYRAHKLDYTTLYPGVREGLAALTDAGHISAILTNKPVRISIEIIHELGLGHHFLRIYGGNSFETKKPDPVGVHTLLQETGVSKELALFIGDSSVDIETARNAGIASCGLTYGFKPESLGDCPPDHLIDNFLDLIPIVESAKQVRTGTLS